MAFGKDRAQRRALSCRKKFLTWITQQFQPDNKGYPQFPVSRVGHEPPQLTASTYSRRMQLCSAIDDHAQHDQPLACLLEAWRAGDRRAGERFIALLHQHLSGYMRSLTRDLGSLDGDDILQDVLLTFLHRVDTFDTSSGDGGIVAWFRVTLKRRYWAMAQRESLVEAVAPEQLDVPTNRDAELIEDRRLCRDRLTGVRQAIESGEITIRATTRPAVDALFDHVEAVTLGGAAPCSNLTDVAKQVGWSPSQLSTLLGRIRNVLAPTELVVAAQPASESVMAPAATRAAVERPALMTKEVVSRWCRTPRPTFGDLLAPVSGRLPRVTGPRKHAGLVFSQAGPRGQPRSAGRSALG